jgi:hypothetical protein
MGMLHDVVTFRSTDGADGRSPVYCINIQECLVSGEMLTL